MQLDRDVSLEQSLSIGMYIRFPFEAERSDNEFRDFRIGQIRGINNVARTGLVRFDSPDEDEPSEVEASLRHVSRCRILPGTLFTTRNARKPVRLIIHSA